jgi:predicted N-formylglutamate amidohydrolase
MTRHIQNRSNADDTRDTDKTNPIIQISGTDEGIDQNHRSQEHSERRIFQGIHGPLHICLMRGASWRTDLNFTGAVIHDFGPVYFGRISFWVT